MSMLHWSEQTDKIGPAFLKAQMQFKAPKKSGLNPAFKSHYSTLADMNEACLEALHANGLMVVQAPGDAPGQYGAATEIRHAASGQFLRTSLLLTPSRNDPQGAGSCISYSRRYTLAALLNAEQEDDDANHATNAPKVQQSAPTQSFGQVQKPLTGEQAVARAHEIIQSRKEDGPGTYHPVRSAPTVQSLTGPAGEYVVRFGKKYIGKALNQISDDELRSYMDYISSQAIKSGKPVEGAVAEFMNAANVYLGNTPPTPSEEDLPIPF